MLRVARIIAPQYPHHITQRGNNRADVFFDDDKILPQAAPWGAKVSL